MRLSKKINTFLLTKIKTSSLDHFEAYEYLVKIYEHQLSIYNQTKLLTWSIYPPKNSNFTERPTVLYLVDDHINFRKYVGRQVNPINNHIQPL